MDHSHSIFAYKDDLKCYFFNSSQKDRGTLIYFHGGGWATGSPTSFFSYAEALVQHGIQCALVEYRTAWRHKTGVNAAIEDAHYSTEWVVKHLLRNGMSARILLCGASAGGLLAFHAAMATPRNTAGLILFNPVLDTSSEGFRNKQLPPGGDLSISPLHLLAKERHRPRCLIFHAADDTVITADQSKRFLEQYHHDAQLELYQKGGHGFFNRKEFIPIVAKRITQFADHTLT